MTRETIEVESHVARFVAAVRARGVLVHAPATLEVGPEVDPERFEAGAVLHAGTRLRGARTLVRAGARVGTEAPVTLHDALLGRGAEVRGGYVRDAVLFDGARVGSGAQVRGGTVLEEGARAAHCVGMKQTILLPFATLGSLVNFCDCLLAGGSGPRDHSEVGSGFIHFNYTPRGPKGDKATPSLFGDVPRGVFLDGARIFLGGSGGAVGPVAVGFGAVLGAGGTYRRDCPDGVLRSGEPNDVPDRPFDPAVYGDVTRKWRLNVRYVGNLYALLAFYGEARLPAAPAEDTLGRALVLGASEEVERGIRERLRRMGEFVAALESARGRDLPPAARRSQEWAIRSHVRLQEKLAAGMPFARCAAEVAEERDRFLAVWRAAPTDAGHVARLSALSVEARAHGRAWLEGIVEEICASAEAGEG